ncbi:MAG TPA: hypothetical protein VLM18_12430 [Croceibacterium sp.]|nr:hypothetical protein [Croceibacterium sp.]
MTSRKRSKLQQNTARSRTSQRNAVVIEGSCVIGERGKESALVTDLGLQGCRVRTEAVGVTRSESLVLWLGEVGPIAGKLKWTKGGSLGVLFDNPLDEGTLQALIEAGEPQSNVIPLRA